jgi:opacity protein-like surface antigen
LNRVLVTFITLTCLTAVTARALEGSDDAPADDFARNGWYLGGYGVYAFDMYRGTNINFDGSPGANVRIGYRGYKWFALEAEVEWISGFDSNKGGGIDSRTIIGGFNGRFYPIGGRFQPYALVGVNGMNVRVDNDAGGSDSNDTDFAFRGGLGIDIYAHRNIVVGIEGSYVWGVGDVWEMDYVSVGAGILYRF